MTPLEFRCVVDASALVLLAQTEESDPRAARAADVLPRLGESHGLGAPALIAWEIGNVIHRKRAGQWSTADQRARVARAVLSGVVHVAPGPERVDRAGRLAHAHGLSFYDAAYLELAHSDDACILLTEDRALHESARRALGDARAHDLASVEQLLQI